MTEIERAGDDQEHQRPPALVERTDGQIPLGDEAGRAGGPDDAEPRDHEGGKRERHLAADPAEVGELDRAQAIGHRPEREEQGALHHRVIEEMHDAASEAGLVGQADAEGDVADLRDRRVGEHALHVLLVDGKDRSDEHGRKREDEQQIRDLQCAGGNGDAEHGEEEAQEQVDSNLGCRCRQERGRE